jgi:hypothetical protein
MYNLIENLVNQLEVLCKIIQCYRINQKEQVVLIKEYYKINLVKLMKKLFKNLSISNSDYNKNIRL